MKVRAKFRCESVSPSNPDKPDEGCTIRLTAVISGSAENASFFRWTPSGSISLGIVNPEAAKQFEVGKECYVDFTPAG